MGVKEARQKYKPGMTQGQVADDLGIKLRTYRSYESNQREPSITTAVAMAEYFGCDVREVVNQGKVSYHVVNLTDGDRDKLLAIWDRLPEDGRRALLACARGIMTEYLE